MKFARFTVAVAMLALMLLGSAPVYADSPPEVDGALYGPGYGGSPDIGTYTYLKEVQGGNAWIYHYLSSDTYYVAVVMNPNYVDNVVGNEDSGDSDYLTSAGWDPTAPKDHWMHHGLYKSDALGEEDNHITFGCSVADTWTSWTWQQGLLFNTKGVQVNGSDSVGGDPKLGEWGPFPTPPGPGWEDTESAGTPPGDYQVATSTALNMRKIDADLTDNLVYDSTWDVTMGDGARDTMNEWRSPPLDGYPNYNSQYDWEWPVIYEMSWDVAGCTDIPTDWTTWDPIAVAGAHASPAKGTWDTCTGSIGDYVWDDQDGDGEQGSELFDVGINDVELELWLDDGDGVFESGEDTKQLMTMLTQNDGSGTPGWYLFTNVCAGTYFVRIAPQEFDSGGDLYYYNPTEPNKTGVGDDSDSDGDNPTCPYDPDTDTGTCGQASFEDNILAKVTLAAGAQDLTIDFGVLAGSPPTAVTLSSFAATSSAGSANWLWLGLAGVMAAGSLFWTKRRK